MAAVRSTSPGGALLRSSRMFALPAPIPGPAKDRVQSHMSNTATPAFPTQQAITTLKSARKNGDWGLKRPLPLRQTTKATHPMVRINAIDSLEAITDYTSATDVGINLRKFQELNLPVTVPSANSTADMHLPQKSVFDKDVDVLAIDPKDLQEMKDRRWRFGGPWLAGMDKGEFLKWVQKNVKPRRQEFHEFLRGKLAGEMLEPAKAAAQDNGEEQPTAIDPATLSDAQVLDYIRTLRTDNERLYAFVSEFLDLVPLAPPTQLSTWNSFYQKPEIDSPKTSNPYANSGPPPMHPSAGISYLRTSMYMDNHPLYGPQESHPPVLARVLKPRSRALGMLHAKLGVAGFVVDTSSADVRSNASRGKSLGANPGRVLDKLNIDTKGGSKMWVHPQAASVTATGNVEIRIGDVAPVNRVIAKELLGEIEEIPTGQQITASRIRSDYSRVPMMSNSGAYGMMGASPQR